MANTKIVLDIQSDLVLTSPVITSPSGITASYIDFASPAFPPAVTNVNAALDELAIDISVEESTRLSADDSLSTAISSEASSRVSGDDSLSTALSTEISTEASTRASADASLSTAISAINANDFGRTVATQLAPNSSTYTLAGNGVVKDSEFVYVNGLLQLNGLDYTQTAAPANPNNTIAIVFQYDIENGSVQVAGNVIA